MLARMLVAFLVAGALCAASLKEGKNYRIHDFVAGTWGTEFDGAKCSDNPHTIKFKGGGKRMQLKYSKGTETEPPTELVYQVIAEGPGFLRMKLEGESRKTDAGELVVWDLMLLSPDSYCWHRTDWQAGGCTKPISRCEPLVKK